MLTLSDAEPVRERARSVLAPYFARSRQRRSGVNPERSVTNIENRIPEKIEFRRAEFSFMQLLEWYHGALDVVADMEGITSSDVDEKRNRIVFGIEDPAYEPTMAAALSKAGVPLGFVSFKVTGRTRFLANLADKVDPAPGGVQIQGHDTFDGTTVTSTCSLGWSGTHPSAGWGFVTASHCVNRVGRTVGRTGRSVYQPTKGWYDTPAGWIAVDPAFDFWVEGCPRQLCYSNGQCIPAKCRRSDGAFVTWANGRTGDFRKLAKVQTDWLGYHNIVGRITSLGTIIDRPWVGEIITKVGRDTGRTTGEVDTTCENILAVDAFTGERVWYICQSRGFSNGAHFARQGDSGAPVYLANGDYAYIFGIVVADVSRICSTCNSDFVWSPADRIEADLGDIWDL